MMDPSDCPENMFCNMVDMARGVATDLKNDGRIVAVRKSHVHINGFSCVDASRINPNKKGGVEGGSGETSVTFNGMINFIDNFSPVVTFAENATELCVCLGPGILCNPNVPLCFQ